MGDHSIALITACRPDRTDHENLERTKRLAAAARDAGYGFTVIDGHWTGSGGREWFVLVVADANRGSHLLGQCRRWLKEFEQDFFLFRYGDSQDILQILADGSRKGVQLGIVRLEPGGLTLHDDRSFIFARVFQDAGWFTGLAHSRGANVGITL
jgi:hypothetical protein